MKINLNIIIIIFKSRGWLCQFIVLAFFLTSGWDSSPYLQIHAPCFPRFGNSNAIRFHWMRRRTCNMRETLVLIVITWFKSPWPESNRYLSNFNATLSQLSYKGNEKKIKSLSLRLTGWHVLFKLITKFNYFLRKSSKRF